VVEGVSVAIVSIYRLISVACMPICVCSLYVWLLLVAGFVYSVGEETEGWRRWNRGCGLRSFLTKGRAGMFIRQEI
jgi:hypothetical protein